MSLELFLEALAEPDTKVPASDFIEASDLHPDELGQFARPGSASLLTANAGLFPPWWSWPRIRRNWTSARLFKMCLKDGDEQVLEKAMEGLWEQEDRSVIAGLIHVLHSDKGSQVRAAAAVALGKFPLLTQEGKLLAKDGESIYDSLMKVLKTTANPWKSGAGALKPSLPSTPRTSNSSSSGLTRVPICS